MSYVTKHNFVGGVVSPLVGKREDLATYNNSLAVLTNGRVLPHGGIRKRSGFKWVQTSSFCLYGEENVATSFNFSTDQAYVLVFSDGYVEVFGNTANFSPTVFVSPYGSADIRQLRFTQSADVLYIVHEDYEPRIFYRSEPDPVGSPGIYTFTFETLVFTGGPWRAQNTTATTITPSAVTGTGITLTASASLFEAGHVGSLWALTQPVGVREISGNFTGATQATSNFAITTGAFTLTLTCASWSTSSIALQKSYDSGATWTTVTSYNTNTSAEIVDLADGVLYRCYSTAFGGTNVAFSLAEVTSSATGYATITAFTSATAVTADVVVDFASTDATDEWKEGAWNGVRGYPSLVCFFEDRLVFAANTENPQTFWMSNTADYYNFGQSDPLVDSDALSFSVLSRRVNKIQWLEPDTKLRFGTEDGEWWISGGSGTDAITPTSVLVRQETFYGCCSLQPVRIADRLIFVQRAKHTILDAAYELASDSWKARDISVIAEHLFRESTQAIKEVVFQKLPNSTIWVLRADGTLCCCSYRADQEVLAWAEVETDGTIQSMTLLTTANEDELWVLIDRGTTRQVEKLTADFAGEDTADARFLDGWIEWDGWGDGTDLFHYTFATNVLNCNTFTFSADYVGRRFRMVATNGTDYLDIEGATFNYLYPTKLTCTVIFKSAGITDSTMQTYVWSFLNNYIEMSGPYAEGDFVDVVGGGSHLGNFEFVATGIPTLPFAAYLDTWHTDLVAGLLYNFDFQTLPIAVETKSGGSMELQTQIQEGHISVYQSRGGGVGPDNGNIATINFDTIAVRDLKWSFIEEEGDLYSLPLFTGGVKFTFDGNASNEANLFFRQAVPYPCTVRALNLKVEVSDT